MTKLLILGAGGHGKVIADTAEQTKAFEAIAFLDDRYNDGLNNILHWPIIGKISNLSQIDPNEYAIAIGIGNNNIRAQFFELAISLNFNIPNIIHPTAYISQYSYLGQGSVFFAHSVVNINTQIGNACIINTSASIDHDCQIGNFCHISPGVHLAGASRIGDRSWLGIGSVTKQEIEVGQDCVIGAGAAVIQNVYNNSIVMGVPARLKS